MKEKWKVYIKGVPNRGEEVIKMLTDLGAKNVYSSTGCGEKLIFFIDHKGTICSVGNTTETACIIKDTYTEIKLPKKWKDGDLIVCHMFSGNRYAVYSDDSELMTCNTIITYVDVDNHTYGINGLFDKDDFKLASDEEHKEFYKLLHKHGKDWCSEKKQLVDWKWKPEMTHKFYFIDINGKVNVGIHDKETDNVMFDFGNCFQTKEEAMAMTEKIKKLLNEGY